VVWVVCRAAQARQVSASLCKLSVELKNTTFQHQREARTAVSRSTHTRSFTVVGEFFKVLRAVQ
jgi:hypothetical protein